MKFIISWLLLVGLFSKEGEPKQTTVVILLYPGVELLDFAGPLEVFSLMENTKVVTVAAKPGSLAIMKKTLTITPDYPLETCPQPDILVVPGASPDHIRTVVDDAAVINWIRQTTPKRALTMSVCTGAYVLAKAGLFTGKTVTTHWASTQMLQQMNADARVMEHTRFVEDGKLVTTAGVSAGIDGALRVVSRLKGPAAARSIAETIEYDKWDPNSGLIVGQQPPTKGIRSGKKQAVAKPVSPIKPAGPGTALATDGVDPVCGMTVQKGTAVTMMFGATRYGFCSEICRTRFKREPAKYVSR
ncbi:DJ-1/PfpI family protein [Spirosoma soli]|uniref:DJ-1/PfpI family protein n=1 Tax=Spirosoma soli TaxID=1770529 RepID=A0ABW5M1Q8_9BACT